MNIIRNGLSIARNAIFPTITRSITVTQQLSLKEIREEKKSDSLIIEGVNVPSPRTELLVQAKQLEGQVTKCYLCALDLEVKHTDVMIVSQFVRSNGCILPRRITGLCRMQQRKMSKLVAMAQKAGLMMNLTPSNSNKDPKKRKDWKKYNTYFDERTIFWKRQPRQEDRFRRSGSMYHD